ncbi:spermatogenesis-associated protein 22 isoform X2 [Fukomys damarensis]|uniref:spermatogenesis-associated protein 22 isoform X2 n=1 Tax=Fukomys damarensis TaxID=885580 RepID=UPI00053FA521|nr:spermatogenesis-associated protein 22 isoform X2 [Fukomys damarensis]
MKIRLEVLQKKRNRQPLTSNPLKNDPGISSTSDSYDFPPLPTDWAWEAMNPELASLTKTVNTGQITPSVLHPLRSQDSMPKSIQSNTETSQSGWSYRDDNKNTSWKTWGKNNFRPQPKRTNLVENDGIYSSPMNLGAQQQKNLKISEPHNLTYDRETEVLRQTHSTKIFDSKMKGRNENTLQAFKPSFQQNQRKKQMLNVIPEESTLKEIPLCQLQLREKNNSLRIISAVIESMKYWCEHAQKTVLLFEILAVLDSAVTSGPYYSKTFLMRDGKNTLPCVFYEIDRELPRLIRGQVHRCVGNYDPKKNIFRCVSVRPASAYEQKTFQAFVKIVDAEMRYYTKVMNEI